MADLPIDSDAEPMRWDLCITSGRRAMRVSPQGVRSLIQWLVANGHLARADHVGADGWEEVFGPAGNFGHALLYEGVATGPQPAFLEIGVRFGATPMDPGYGLEGAVHFYLEIRGAIHDRVTEALLDRLDSLLYLRPEVRARPFTTLRSREIEAPPAEGPQRKKRPDRVDGRIGTRVEER